MVDREIANFVEMCRDTRFDDHYVPEPTIYWKFTEMLIPISPEQLKLIHNVWEDREKRLDSTWFSWTYRRRHDIMVIGIAIPIVVAIVIASR
jgi:hypothetical protein